MGLAFASSCSQGTGYGPWRLKMSLCFPVNGEKVHLEEILSKKQGIYQLLHLLYSTPSPHESLKFPASQRNLPET